MNKAIEATSSEMIQGNIIETVKNFFKVAAQAGVLNDQVLQTLMGSVSLKT